MKIKRTKYLFFYHRNFPKLDFNSILTASTPKMEKQIVAIPILYGSEVILTEEEFDLLIRIPENEWIEYEVTERFETFFKCGMLLNEQDEFKIFKEREDILVRDNWHIYSALFNFMTKWKDINVKLITNNVKMDSSEDMKSYIELYGKPPLHYHQVSDVKDKVEIENVNFENDPFFNLLTKRKTTRNFDTKSKLSFKDLSTIIKYSFGTQGSRGLYDSDVKAIKRTSPSGGDLHPTELFLLVLRIENLDTGIYHYNTELNELHLIKPYSLDEAIAKAKEFSAGQEYTSDSSVMFFLSTRYYRNYWKYRKNSAAYSVTVRDGAHICQNIYLICTRLNIGCYTAAINHVNIENEIGLNSYEHGITMMMGCGIIEQNPSVTLEPVFT